jgi:uncharacterized protein YjcR
MDEICGAKTRAGTPCMQKAGWGTSHLGEGRCKLHGGSSPGGPVANKKALATGEYERITLSTFEPEELELAQSAKVDAYEQVKEAILVLSIRERRMIKRIAKLSGIEYVVIERSPQKGYHLKGTVDLKTIVERNALEQIMRIEDSLTTVAARKARYLELLHKLQVPEKDGSIEDLMSALNRAMERYG